MDILSKQQLLVEMKRFFADKKRGIAINHFAELCGLSVQLLRDVFIDQVSPLTETTQIRVNKAYAEWKAGNVKTMFSKRRRYYIDYRKEPKPPIIPSLGLTVKNGVLALRVGPRNRHDYSEATLKERLNNG